MHLLLPACRNSFVSPMLVYSHCRNRASPISPAAIEWLKLSGALPIYTGSGFPAACGQADSAHCPYGGGGGGGGGIARPIQGHRSCCTLSHPFVPCVLCVLAGLRFLTEWSCFFRFLAFWVFTVTSVAVD